MTRAELLLHCLCAINVVCHKAYTKQRNHFIALLRSYMEHATAAAANYAIGILSQVIFWLLCQTATVMLTGKSKAFLCLLLLDLVAAVVVVSLLLDDGVLHPLVAVRAVDAQLAERRPHPLQCAHPQLHLVAKKCCSVKPLPLQKWLH